MNAHIAAKSFFGQEPPWLRVPEEPTHPPPARTLQYVTTPFTSIGNTEIHHALYLQPKGHDSPLCISLSIITILAFTQPRLDLNAPIARTSYLHQSVSNLPRLEQHDWRLNESCNSARGFMYSLRCEKFEPLGRRRYYTILGQMVNLYSRVITNDACWQQK